MEDALAVIDPEIIGESFPRRHRVSCMLLAHWIRLCAVSAGCPLRCRHARSGSLVRESREGERARTSVADDLCHAGLLRGWGVELGQLGEGASTFAVAYVVHKATVPVRIPLTIALVPIIARVLRRGGPPPRVS